MTSSTLGKSFQQNCIILFNKTQISLLSDNGDNGDNGDNNLIMSKTSHY